MTITNARTFLLDRNCSPACNQNDSATYMFKIQFVAFLMRGKRNYSKLNHSSPVNFHQSDD